MNITGRVYLQGLLIGFLSLALMGFSTESMAAARRGAVVIFTANWCASCRDVNPIVQEVASQNGLQVQEIDVDKQDAPAQAHNFGLTIPNSDPPEVYLVNNGHVSLLYQSKKGLAERPDSVRQKVLQNLQLGLGK